MRRLGRGLALLATLAFAASPSLAQEMEIPVAVQLPLFLKILSFDHQLVARAAGAPVIAIAFQSGYRPSEQTRDELLRLAGDTRPSIAGVRIRFVSIDLDRESLAEQLVRDRVTILYLAPVRGMNVREIAAATRAARVTTVTGVSRYVELGLAVGARLRGDRPQILVNLIASRLEGAELGAELLKLAQIL